MFRNIFKISFRILVKERFYSLVNIFGLAIGIGSAFLIAQYILNETSYDKHHPDGDFTYRVNQTNIWSPDGGIMGSSVLPLAEALKTEFPEVISTLRINTPYSQLFSNNKDGDFFLEENVLAADSSFFDFFNFSLAYGNPSTTLDRINTVVVSHDIAIKYFGTADVVGKTLLLGNDKIPLEITGVLAEEQKNTHFEFDILYSIYTNPNVKRFEWSWIWTQAVTYVKIKGDIQPLKPRLAEIADKYAEGAFRRLGMDLKEFEKEKGEITFYLQPIEDIHLHSVGINNRIGVDGNITYVYIFSLIGIIILLLAAINFINLATARAVKRFKEIGVRKVLGSTKRQIILQLLLESLFICVLATIAGLGLSELMRIALANSLGITFKLELWSDPLIYIYLLATPFVIGVCAGIYPAIYMTSYKPVDVLKGKRTSGKEGNLFRNALVVVQFTIAIALMISTLLIGKQLKFFQNSNMGFSRDNILVVEDTQLLESDQQAFINYVHELSEVSESSITSIVPCTASMEDIFYSKNDPDRKISLNTIKVDDNYLSQLNIELLAGRNFSKVQPERPNVIINEMAMRKFGWDLDNALGQKIEYFEDEFTVIGVTANFHSMPFYFPIAPVVLFDLEAPMFNSSQHMLLSINMENRKKIVQQLQSKWIEINPDKPFNYSFLDETLSQIYENEEELSKLFIVFTTLAMKIALIGLIGLAAYITSQKMKEIGVRKVLGASVGQLVLMVNAKFSKLIFISCLLAMPIAYYAIDSWLQKFEFKIEIGPGVFIITLITVMVATWVTVSFHSIKSALTNPVDTLKDE